MDDNQLIAAIRSHDKNANDAAMEFMYKEYSPMLNKKILISYPWYQKANAKERKEIYNEISMLTIVSVVKAVRAPEWNLGGARFSTFYYTCLENMAKKNNKYHKKRSFLFFQMPVESEQVSEVNYEEQLTMQRVLEELRRRSPECAECIKLKYYEGRDHKSIAEALNLKTSEASRKKLSQCLGTFKELYKKLSTL